MELRELVISHRLPFCNICQEFVFVEWSTSITPCEHTFCWECIKEHVGVMLQEHRFLVNCPDCLADPSIEEGSSKSCLSSSQELDKRDLDRLFTPEISYAQVETLLTDAQREKWWELEVAPFAVIVRCPG
jgi:hypothetical protein